jgi:Tol biopolymer transport system component
MNEFRTRFREADRIPAPDLWPDIASRRPGRLPAGSDRPRVAIAVLALAVAAVGIFVVARAFFGPAETPAGPAVPTPTPFVPALKENGLIAFTRIDPDSLIPDGAIPRAALFSVHPDGTEPSRLTDFGYLSTSSWSPDGTRIAVTASWDGPHGLFVLNEDGSNPTRLVTCDGRCDGQDSPAWSPDGTRLAFWGDRDGREGLWTINADGSGLKLLAEDLAFGQPSWSPDGRLIAISGNVPDDPRPGIFLVDSRTGEVVRALHPNGLSPSDVAWSPDGKLLALAAHEGDDPEADGIYLLRPDGTDLRLVASTTCRRIYCWERSPEWSPDGRFIAFAVAGSEPDPYLQSGDLYVVEVDTGEIRRLTEGPNPDCCPAWQPVTSR